MGIQIQTSQSVANTTGPVNLNEDRRSASDFGADVFNTIGNAAMGQAKKLQDSADRAAVLEADNSLAAWEQENLYGENGYLATAKGKNSIGAGDSLLSNYDKFTSEISQGITRPVQREAFARASSNRRNQISANATKHEFREVEKYKQEQNTAAIANSTIAASDNYQDVGVVQGEIHKQNAIIMADAADNGEPLEVTDNKLRAAQSGTVTAVISRALAEKNYGYAKTFFDQNKESLLPADRNRLEGAVNTGNTRAVAQANTDSIVNKGMTLTDSLKAARKISDPEVRDSVVQRVKARFSEQSAIEQQTQKDAMEKAADMVEQSGDTDSVPPELWEMLSPGQRSGLENRSRQVQSGVEPVTDWKVYTDLSTMTPLELSKINMLDYRDKLTNAQYQSFLGAQRQAVNAVTKGTREPSYTATLTFKDRTKATAGSAGIIPIDKTPAKYSEDEARRYGVFQEQAATRLQAFEEQKGGKANGDEIQKILDDMVIQDITVKQGFFSDTKKFAYEIKDDETGTAFVEYENIPAGDTTKIKNLLTSYGTTPTKEKVGQIYAAFLMNDYAKAKKIMRGE
ncbi:hypothetical protein [Photobacterium profundum]|uniref:Coil containing protein n=1 Tax=Photobacterium profundum (strain SS9) TaxID=298386 RepID=Q6LJT1_PHOPR|nr:hypothetical protein [Photobacterium profundum]CAG22449.1 hypothetical protein PBPRB0576 [Photobacterium profundum SS9]